jgi:hypothetical protein
VAFLAFSKWSVWRIFLTKWSGTFNKVKFDKLTPCCTKTLSNAFCNFVIHMVSCHVCMFIPLQVEQGGINFTPLVLSLPCTKKNSLMDGGQLKNVCLSVVCRLSVGCSQLFFEPLVWLGEFFLQKLEKMCMWKF